ncbi:amino acid ABC transporter permease, partial [Sinorhizobium medicae]|nr:amino acid ABC transporter permease [Sinorhizobium medicae]
MSTQQATFVRASMIEASPAPSLERGAASWLRRNLFATPKDSVLTIISLLILAWLVPPAIQWLFIDAAWSGGGRGVCATLSQ